MLVVGLGNPGLKYQNTRHNVGFLVLDELVDTWKDDKRHKALSAHRSIGGIDVHFIKPQTFMNLSGDTVQSYASYYNVEPKYIVVVHDDADIAFGEVRTKTGGGSAGHNGLKSIDSKLGTQGYKRVRVGIGRPPENMPLDKFVLGKWTEREKQSLQTLLEHATHKIDQIIVDPQ